MVPDVVSETVPSSSTTIEAYKTPTDVFKSKLIELLFANIEHNSRSMDDPMAKHAFVIKTKALSTLLEKYTPKSIRKETFDFYKQLEEKIKEIRDSKSLNITEAQKEGKILQLKYEYATKVDLQNQRVIVNSPIVEAEVEGELNVDDIDVRNMIQGEKRTDDRKLEFKR